MIFMQCMKIIFVSIHNVMLPHSLSPPPPHTHTHKTSHLFPSNFNVQVCLIPIVLDHPTGPLGTPFDFSVNISNTSNTSFLLSWGAPFSLDVTDSPDIFYYTLCTNITIYGCKNISSDPDCTFPKTCISSVDFTDPSLNGTNGGQNKTIMDYGDPIHFTFFAVNGAGNGATANLTYLFKKQSGYYFPFHFFCWFLLFLSIYCIPLCLLRVHQLYKGYDNCFVSSQAFTHLGC